MTALTPEKMTDALERGLARRSLQSFCERVDPWYEPAAHTRLLIEHLEAVERYDIDKLMVFMPPRHGKTYHVSERFPAWFMGRHPRDSVILASYSAELAEQNSRKARGILQADRWPFPDVAIAKNSSAVNRWGTEAGGTVIAAGVGGTMTGFGANTLIIDDPLKGRAEADSPTYRDGSWSWYTDTARTRMMRRGRQIIPMTRWHEDDLAGRLLNSKGANEWTVLVLPAIAGENDVLGREPGAELWPEGGITLPRVDLGEISSRSYDALYQQAPTPETGRTFQRAWLQNRYRALPQLDYTVASLDAAWKDGVGNSWSVIALWGTDGVKLFVINIWRERVEYPDLKAAVIAYAREWQPDVFLVEDAAGGIPAIQELRRDTPIPIVSIRASVSKEARAEAITPTFEAQRVYLPDEETFPEASWVYEWVEEHAKFPAGTANDQVDTSSMAVPRLVARLQQQFAFGTLDQAKKKGENKWQR